MVSGESLHRCFPSYMNLTSLLKLALSPADHSSPGVLELKLPFAEIDSSRNVRRINALGTMAWGWSEGSEIPRIVDIALEGASTARPSELPFQLGGLLIGVIPDSAEGGWMLIGYSLKEKGVRDAIIADVPEEGESIKRDSQHVYDSAQLDAAKLAFVSTLSHEIRSPIGAITGYSELVERELKDFFSSQDMPLSPLVMEFVRAIGERSRALQKVVTNLFELSELYNSDFGVDNDPVDLHIVLNASIGRSTMALDRSKVDLNVRFWDARIFVESNAARLGQIFDNVLSNAVKFTDSGEIEIRTIPEAEHVVIEIKDSGVGISHEFISQIFDAFSQEDSRRAREFEGIGMGLALSRRLLERLGGTIEARSEKNSGSVFRIRLPVISDQNPFSIMDENLNSYSPMHS